MSRERVLQVLKGNNAHRINFRIRLNRANGEINTEVNGSTFRRVADAIESNRIKLFVCTANEMPTLGAGAAYQTAPGISANKGYFKRFGTSNISANTMFIQQLHGRVQESLLIHEAVHASFDLTRSNVLSAAGQETVCYIAEVLYRRITGLQGYRLNWNEPIRIAAVPVINSMIRSGNFLSTRPIDVSLDSIGNLVQAITNHNIYQGIRCYVTDG